MGKHNENKSAFEQKKDLLEIKNCRSYEFKILKIMAEDYKDVIF